MTYFGLHLTNGTAIGTSRFVPSGISLARNVPTFFPHCADASLPITIPQTYFLTGGHGSEWRSFRTPPRSGVAPHRAWRQDKLCSPAAGRRVSRHTPVSSVRPPPNRRRLDGTLACTRRTVQLVRQGLIASIAILRAFRIPSLIMHMVELLQLHVLGCACIICAARPLASVVRSDSSDRPRLVHLAIYPSSSPACAALRRRASGGVCRMAVRDSSLDGAVVQHAMGS
ncbi:hypothetical protein BD413DRAFT_184289 [Trametes elegans]|nr:hypothetical protein BD413DRAFT_184289 [Trametes elegans]